MLNFVLGCNRHVVTSIGRDQAYNTHSKDLRWEPRGKIQALQPLGENMAHVKSQ
jgi:hypothetical protein